MLNYKDKIRGEENKKQNRTERLERFWKLFSFPENIIHFSFRGLGAYRIKPGRGKIEFLNALM